MSTSAPGSRRQAGKGGHKMQPLDRAAWVTILLLAVIIGAMLMLGSQALPKVRSFSWQGQAVAAEDVAFLLTFTQPVAPQSVEKNLQIEPALSGKFSWAGRKMAYTLKYPAPYGESYKISLPEATALSGQDGFEPFEGTFHTRDRIFAYIGAEGEEQGRLILFNFTQKEKTLLTPQGQRVMDFKPYPGRDRILFSAVDMAEEADGLAIASLYNVSTGLGEVAESPKWKVWQNLWPQQNTTPAEAGTIDLVLDNQDYQNLKFDLSPNGKVIVVQRVNQQNPADFGPWVIEEGKAPRPLKTDPGGDFTIAPDSQSLLLQQGEGTAVIALAPESTDAPDDQAQASEELLDFLPDYGLTLDIANDGSAAALVNFNQDDPEKQFTQTLFWVSNRGTEKPLLDTDGSILSAQFNENNELLYCLVNRLVEGPGVDPDAEVPDTEAPDTEDGQPEEPSQTEQPETIDLATQVYQVIPYLTVINVETGEEQKLLEMPPQPEITVSPSPDGLAILFDEALITDPQIATEGFAGETHRLWILPLFGTVEERLNGKPIPLPPAELELSGRHPIWLP